jgi:predicted nucleic acid-binding protein
VIVIDASVAVACLINTTESEKFFDKIMTNNRLAAPSLIEYEIGSALRRLCWAGKLDEKRAEHALLSIAGFSIEIHDPQLLAPRMWGLRQNISYYDASYVVLAEMLEIPFYTMDKRLASAPGHNAKIICL